MIAPKKNPAKPHGQSRMIEGTTPRSAPQFCQDLSALRDFSIASGLYGPGDGLDQVGFSLAKALKRITPMPAHQFSLTLIPHKVDNSVVDQRASDGYINATAMCQAASKKFSHYQENATTKAYLAELAADAGIPASELVQVIKGGEPHLQGSWVHPHVALHLAQWLSAKFAVQVSKWVHDWMSGKLTPTKLPYHLERHMLNYHKIPTGYFSVLQEMTNRMVAPMEAQGYRLPEHLMPDISHAKMLCKFLRDHRGVNTNALPVYIHTFPDGREVEANLYPVEYLGDFLKLLTEVWFPTKAVAYFKPRDPDALAALDKMLMIGAAPKPKLPNSANKTVFKKKA